MLKNKKCVWSQLTCHVTYISRKEQERWHAGAETQPISMRHARREFVDPVYRLKGFRMYYAKMADFFVKNILQKWDLGVLIQSFEGNYLLRILFS